MLKNYQLPNVRCINCNKPVAHLFALYKELQSMGFCDDEVFNTLGVIRYCCRREFSTATIVPLLTCIESKMKDVNVNKFPIIRKETYEVEEIDYDEKNGVPTLVKATNVIKMLNDTLYVTYSDSSEFIAQ
jgi:DNA-directed RNA polymerase subunit N (RpoN/RPB10)